MASPTFGGNNSSFISTNNADNATNATTNGNANATTPTTTTSFATAPLRYRQVSGELPRLSTPSVPLPRRRSSVLSLASDTRQSVQSSAGDVLLPALDSGDTRPADSSHWDSSPLAFAILPAIGGLFFQNGSAFITDVLIIGLAAIFLNWTVRLPWQWYLSAQATQTIANQPRRPSHVIDDVHDSPPSPKSRNDSIQPDEAQRVTGERDEREEAVEALKMQERLAFLSTILAPAMGAYILHIIRGSLSRNTTAIVTDYNLTIFLLAAEIRPFRQLIKMMTSRTMHLQKIVRGDFVPIKDTITNAELVSRLEILEAKVSEPTLHPAGGGGVQHKDDVAQLSLEVKKRYEPRIDALERAVRRYEKRVTTLTMLTDQRLTGLDHRLQDALSLAAVAAHSSQKPSVVAATASYMGRVAVMPVEMACHALVLPLRMGEDLLRMLLGVVGAGGAGGGGGGAGGMRRKREAGKGKTSRSREKKPVREEAVAVTPGR